MEKILHGIDLHLHTTCSDGTRTLKETIQDAYEFGLSHIAITDHNQFAILEPETFQTMEVIPGAEFSTAYYTETGRLVEVHVVGLFFEGVPEGIRDIFGQIPLQRKKYVNTILEKLQELGCFVSYEELEHEFPDSNQIGRRHIAEILVKKGYAKSITDAFDRLIGNRSQYWVDSTQYMKYMPLESCVKDICEYGGFAILAHPYHYHMTDAEILKLIKDFKKASRDVAVGMEVFYSKYNQEKREILLNIAEEQGLLPSAASDRHAQTECFVRGDDNILFAMKDAFALRKK